MQVLALHSLFTVYRHLLNNNTASPNDNCQVAPAFPSHLSASTVCPHFIFLTDSVIVLALSSLFHRQHLVSFDVADKRTLSSPA